MSVKSFEVTQPPTAQAVRQELAAALSTSGIMRCTLACRAEEPGQDPGEIAFFIMQGAPDGPNVGGKLCTTDRSPLTLHLPDDESQPATLSMVSKLTS